MPTNWRRPSSPLLAIQHLRETLGRNGRRYVQQAFPANTATAYIEVLNEFVGEEKRRSRRGGLSYPTLASSGLSGLPRC